MIERVLKLLRESPTVIDIAQDTGFDLEKLVEGTCFVVELGADDLDILLIAMDIEDEFDIMIEEHELASVTSAASVAHLLGMKL